MKNKLYKEIISKENFLNSLEKLNKKISPGIDKISIKEYFKKTNEENYNNILKRLENFKPGIVKKINIKKENNKNRELGIYNIEDKIIQLMFFNILNSKIENNFYDYSFAYRENKKQEHAIARLNTNINLIGLTYCINLDIENFFNNIDHNKLIRQLWKIGIRDKKVIKIIKLMLKPLLLEENGKTKRKNKGLIQGNILSSLFSNVYLNEFDWWIDKQWCGFKTKTNFTRNSSKYIPLKKTNLNEVYLVRYGEEIKLLTRTYEQAIKINKLSIIFLKEKLNLNLNDKKSNIVNLKKKKTNFLGFSIGIKEKGLKETLYKEKVKILKNKELKKFIKKHNGKTTRNGFVSNTSVERKKILSIKNKLKSAIKEISKSKKNLIALKVLKYNKIVKGVHNYFKLATEVNKNFNLIEGRIRVLWNNKLKRIPSSMFSNDKLTKNILNYENFNGKNIIIKDIVVLPISYVQHKNPMNYSVKNKSENDFKKNLNELENNLFNNEIIHDLQFKIKRINIYETQRGICQITGEFLKYDNFDIHHIIPRSFGGNDDIENLLLIKKEVHKKIHSNEITNDKKILKYKKIINELYN